MPEDFENEIAIKKDLATLLNQRLTKAKTLLPDVVALSGVTDPYQAAEKKYKNTRQCLEVLLKHGYPVHIITKSELVFRDLDLLQAIAEKNWCTISVTITTTDEAKARFLEKRSPSPEKRFKVIEEIKAKAPSVQVGVLAIPVIPYFTDTKEELEKLYAKAKKVSADYLLFGGGMTMHDAQALYFLKQVSHEYPELIPKYEELFNFKYNQDKYTGAMVPSAAYMQEKNQMMLELNQKYELPYRIKRYIPKDYRQVNYHLAEKLLNESYDLQLAGKDYDALYWAGQNIQNLDISLVQLQQFGQLNTVKNLEDDILVKVEKYLNDLA